MGTNYEIGKVYEDITNGEHYVYVGVRNKVLHKISESIEKGRRKVFIQVFGYVYEKVEATKGVVSGKKLLLKDTDTKLKELVKVEGIDDTPFNRVTEYYKNYEYELDLKVMEYISSINMVLRYKGSQEELKYLKNLGYIEMSVENELIRLTGKCKELKNYDYLLSNVNEGRIKVVSEELYEELEKLYN